MFFKRRMITVGDRQTLLHALDRARQSWVTYAPYLDALRAELRRTRGVAAQEIPDDVITMNSRFSISAAPAGTEHQYTLVFPEQEEQHSNRVSVLSPMGSAFLGARVGQDVFWFSSAGPEVARVRRLLYQPERDGLDELRPPAAGQTQRKQMVLS